MQIGFTGKASTAVTLPTFFTEIKFISIITPGYQFEYKKTQGETNEDLRRVYF